MAEESGTWIDSHCHVDLDDDPEVLDRAWVSGVSGCVVIGTNAERSRGAIRAALAEAPGGSGTWPTRFATIGLHPHDATDGVGDVATLLAEHVVPRTERAAGAVVGVGECGLDYYYEHAPRDAQREVFPAQIELARALDLTLVVHTRDAWADTFAILHEVGVPERTVIHCFTGGATEARACLELGAYLSFSGIVTFKNAEEVREAAVLCPADRILVETDAPYLAPVPHRGEANEPGYVPIVGRFLAGLRGAPPSELGEVTRANTARAFALPG